MFVIAGILSGLAVLGGCERPRGGGMQIAPATLVQAIRIGKAPLILDVRSPEEFTAAHIPGAINISYTDITSRINELPSQKDAPIVVHCETGRRAAAAQSLLIAAGYTRILDLEGHMRAWAADSYPLVVDAQTPSTHRWRNKIAGQGR